MASGGRVSEVRGEQAGATAEALRWPEALLPVSGAASSVNASDAPGAIEVALLWGDRLLDVKQFPKGTWPTLGHLPQDSIHVFAKNVGASFPLVREVDGERRLSVPVGARLAIFGPQRTLGEAALMAGGFLRQADDRPGWEVALGAGERALISMGALLIAVRDVPRAPRVSIRALTDLDFSFAKLFAVTALIAAAFVTILLMPGTATSLVDDSIFGAAGVVKFKPQAPAKPPEKVKKLSLKGPAQSTASSAPSIAEAPRDRKAADKAAAGNLLDALKKIAGGGGSVFGGGLDQGVNNAISQLGRGGMPIAQEGLGGLTARGTGPGPGGGVGVGIGGIGGTCDAKCIAARSGTGFANGDLRQRVHVSSDGGKTTVVGGLDKDVIARVIKAHQSEIKACYERTLTENPDAGGKVTVAFTIGGTGFVTQAIAAENSTESASLEQCMLARIQRWKFPEPRGGGEVAVNYPWIFHRAGTDAE